MDLEARHQRTATATQRRGMALATFFRMRAPADDTAFALFALRRYGATTDADVEALKEAHRAPTPQMPDLCVRILDGSLPDGPSIAKYVEQANADYDAKLAAPYEAALARLSPRVHTSVSQEIDQVAASMLGGSEFDNVAAAQDDPETYKQMKQSLCRGKKYALEHPLPQTPPLPLLRDTER